MTVCLIPGAGRSPAPFPSDTAARAGAATDDRLLEVEEDAAEFDRTRALPARLSELIALIFPDYPLGWVDQRSMRAVLGPDYRSSLRATLVRARLGVPRRNTCFFPLY